MQSPLLRDLLRRRHRGLQTRIAALQCDTRARRTRVVQLAEELVAHATVEQLVLYPYAAQLLGLEGLSFELERSLQALLAVITEVGNESAFQAALARLSLAFERHAEGDEVHLLPLLDSFGSPEHLARMAQTIEEFERGVAPAVAADDPCSWPGVAGASAARSRGAN